MVNNSLMNRLQIKDYGGWCQFFNVNHAHCPDNCEHPQPIVVDHKLICGRCWFKYNQITLMTPCECD